jgi:hypothetical protein
LAFPAGLEALLIADRELKNRITLDPQQIALARMIVSDEDDLPHA